MLVITEEVEVVWVVIEEVAEGLVAEAALAAWYLAARELSRFLLL